MIIKPAKRTESVQEYYFSRKLKEIAEMNAGRIARGEESVINLGIGSPDGMPPEEAVEALCEGARQPGNHAYQSYVGIPELRAAFAGWYREWYGVELDPATEIQPLVGSKEAILLISLAFLDKGDKVLVPDPGYPTYSSASRLVEADIITYDLCAENGWWPDFDALESMDLDGVKIMWTNYPNMPTGTAASEELYARLVDFGRRHGILICNDNPYSFILNDRPLSVLAQPGSKECCLELNSLSKAHNMAGWRIGMVAADQQVISEILKVKSQMDSGMFKPLQLAAVQALSQGPEWFSKLNAEYRRRRVLAGEIFDLLGVEYDHDSSGMFLWGKVGQSASGFRSGDDQASSGQRLSDWLLYEAGVFITPGFIFGKNGEDYIRISLCAKPEVLKRAAEKIRRAMQVAE
ncbi:MAG: aminotransferase class I/II-fold pyridoxal phosphate-dependent enzyme [Bacteroidales bacterium]|nr:aminotransferase class I/II-fold pyridoxal phosphate-dependent enzyme [Bacteroidales bacterium]